MRENNKTGLMPKTEAPLSEKILIAASYFFGLPAFYIILTEKRKNKVLAFHSAQALLLWLSVICISVVLKLFINLLLSVVFIPFFYIVYDVITFLLWLYCIYCAVMFILGKDVNIPLISGISRKLI